MSNFTSPAQSINGLYLKALNALIGELSTTEFKEFDKEAFAKAQDVDVLLIDVLVDMGFLIEGWEGKYPAMKADKSLYNVGPEPAMAWVERAKAEKTTTKTMTKTATKPAIKWHSPAEEGQIMRVKEPVSVMDFTQTAMDNSDTNIDTSIPVADTGYLVVTPTDSFLADSYDDAVSVGQKHSRADDVIVEIFKRVATVECVQSFKVTPC